MVSGPPQSGNPHGYTTQTLGTLELMAPHQNLAKFVRYRSWSVPIQATGQPSVQVFGFFDGNTTPTPYPTMNTTSYHKGWNGEGLGEVPTIYQSYTP